MAKQNNNAKEIFEVLTKAQSPICLIDERVDMDAFCSAFALEQIVTQNGGKPFRFTYLSTIRPAFKEIIKSYVEIDRVETETSPVDVDFTNHDVVVYIDAADFGKPAKFEEYTLPEGTESVNIDHHARSNPLFGTYNYVFEEPSACTVLYRFIKELGLEIDSKTANMILLGMFDDSQIFTIAQVTASDLTYAGELFEMTDLKVFQLVHDLRFHESREEVLIKKIMFKNLVVDYDNRIAYSFTTMEDYEEYDIDFTNLGFNVSASEEIRRIEGTDFAAFVKPGKAEGEFTLSLRSRTKDYDVARIAEAFDHGGGHKAAAGAFISGVKDHWEVINKVIETKKIVDASD